MKFLSNIHDPKDPNARMYLPCDFHEAPEQAWQRHLEWLKGKVIAEPKATEKYSVSELKQMNMVGVYLPD